MIREAKANRTRSVLRENTNRPSDFWNQIERAFLCKTGKEKYSKVFKINRENIYKNKKIANEFCSFLTCIGKKLQESLLQIVNPTWRNHVQDTPQKSLNPNSATFTFTETNPSKVQIIPKKLKRKKSSGCDDIPRCIRTCHSIDLFD